MKIVVAAITISSTLLWQCPAMSEGVRPCTASEQSSYGSVNSSDDDRGARLAFARHRRFEIPSVLSYHDDAHVSAYGMDLMLLVDEAGRVVCQTNKSLDPRTTPQRQAVYHEMTQWQYEPFLEDSRPARVLVEEHIDEENLPVRHVSIPSASLADTKISLHTFYGIITLDGDGRGRFQDGSAQPGNDTSHDISLAPGEMASLVEELKRMEFWSLDDAYVRQMPDDMGGSTLIVSRANWEKRIVYQHENIAGMPVRLRSFLARVEALADAKHSYHTPALLLPPIPVPPQPRAQN